jgi:type VI secretion system protein ImpE
MDANELYRAGRLDEAIQALGAALRRDPMDAQRRIFLFELLCFAGELDRAEKQIDVVAQSSSEAGAGALLLRSGVHAERTRKRMFDSGELPPPDAAAPAVSGTLNGQAFSSLEDADPRIGARLEVFAAGQYTLLPWEHVASVRMEAPGRLRDLLWATAMVRTGPGFQGTDLGEVLLPALTPGAGDHSDPEVRLGRVTLWEELPDGREAPAGQKMLLVDGEEFPFLEVRELDIASPTPD